MPNKLKEAIVSCVGEEEYNARLAVIAEVLKTKGLIYLYEIEEILFERCYTPSFFEPSEPLAIINYTRRDLIDIMKKCEELSEEE